jgi:hypothetical protein
MSKKLFVGNLPFQTTESDITAAFETFGSIESVSIITDRDTGRSKGFGYLSSCRLLTLARHLTFYPFQFCTELFYFTLRVLDVARRRGTGWTSNISSPFVLSQDCFFFCEL